MCAPRAVGISIWPALAGQAAKTADSNAAVRFITLKPCAKTGLIRLAMKSSDWIN